MFLNEDGMLCQLIDLETIYMPAMFDCESPG